MNPNIPTIRFFKTLDTYCNNEPCLKLSYYWMVSLFSYVIYLPIRLLSMQVCHISVCMPPHKRIVSQQQPGKIKYRQGRLLITYFFTIKILLDYIIFTCAATTRISPRTSSGMPSNICSCSPPSPVVSDFYII